MIKLAMDWIGTSSCHEIGSHNFFNDNLLAFSVFSVTTAMGYFVLFGSAIFVFGWVKPTVAEIKEGYDRAARQRSVIKDELTSLHQMMNEQFDDLKKTIAGIDSVPAFSNIQPHESEVFINTTSVLFYLSS